MYDNKPQQHISQKVSEVADHMSKEIMDTFEIEQRFELLVALNERIQISTEQVLTAIKEKINSLEKQHALYSDLLKNC